MDNLKIKCRSCGSFIDISNSSDIEYSVRMRCKDNSSKEFFLTYTKCKNCNNIQYFQVDNSNSIEKLKEVKKLMIRGMKKKLENKQIPLQQSNKIKEAQKHLDDYRKKLMKEVTGKTLVDENRNEFYIDKFTIM